MALGGVSKSFVISPARPTPPHISLPDAPLRGSLGAPTPLRWPSGSLRWPLPVPEILPPPWRPLPPARDQPPAQSVSRLHSLRIVTTLRLPASSLARLAFSLAAVLCASLHFPSLFLRSFPFFSSPLSLLPFPPSPFNASRTSITTHQRPPRNNEHDKRNTSTITYRALTQENPRSNASPSQRIAPLHYLLPTQLATPIPTFSPSRRLSSPGPLRNQHIPALINPLD